MTQTKAHEHNKFLIVIGISYSVILIIGSIYPRGYAPPDYHFTLYDNAMLAIPFVHILLFWLSWLNGRLQKWIVFINLWLYFFIMFVLLWMLRENDLNIFIIVFMLIWVILVIWNIDKWRSLQKRDLEANK